MGLIRRTKTRITAKQVGELLGCSHKTVLKGGAGTEGLTRIRNGPKQVRFLLEEVLALAQRQEQAGTNTQKLHITISTNHA
jgi:hypothetical protein